VYYAEHPEEIEGYIKEHAVAEEDTSDVPYVLRPLESGSSPASSR
jgi:hypothetical protein